MPSAAEHESYPSNRGHVSDEEHRVRASFERDGYVIFPQLLDRELVEEASGHIGWLMQRYPDRRPENLDHDLVAGDPFWVRLISDDRLLDVAQQFVGPDIALFASHYIVKPPFDGKPVLWHQDAAYWPLEPMSVVTLWLAIDDSTTENGCLRVVPGSHRDEVARLRAREDVDNVLASESDLDSAALDARAVDLVLSAGDAEVHHPAIMHSSMANLSPKRRAGLTIRYIPTTTRIVAEQPYCSAIHLRGAQGVNLYQPRPSFVPGQHYAFRGAV